MRIALGRLKTLVLFVLLLGIAAAIVTDMWMVNGRVVDVGGAPIGGVKVLITFRGAEFRAPIPHARTAHSKCLYSTVAETDHAGRFSVFRITSGAVLKSKLVTADAFLPGWYQSSTAQTGVPLFSFAASTKLRLTLQSDQGERWSFVGENGETRPLTLDRLSPLYQNTMSRALTGAADLGDNLSGCAGTGEMLAAAALNYAIQNARTDDELLYMRNRCVDAKNRAPRRIDSWPRGCDAFLSD